MSPEKADVRVNIRITTCSRCGDLPEDARAWTMHGGYYAILCVRCLNEWSAHVRNLSHWREYEVALHAVRGGTDNRDTVRHWLSADEQMYATAREWVQRGRPADEDPT